MKASEIKEGNIYFGKGAERKVLLITAPHLPVQSRRVIYEIVYKFYNNGVHGKLGDRKECSLDVFSRWAQGRHNRKGKGIS